MTLAAEIVRFLDGASDLTPADVADVAAVLILVSGKPPENAQERAILDQFSARAGLGGDNSDGEIARHIIAYFEGRPSLRLVTVLGQLVREELANAPARKDFAAIIGQAASLGTVLGGGERPAGTVPAGPGARFTVPSKLDKPSD